MYIYRLWLITGEYKYLYIYIYMLIGGPTSVSWLTLFLGPWWAPGRVGPGPSNSCSTGKEYNSPHLIGNI